MELAAIVEHGIGVPVERAAIVGGCSGLALAVVGTVLLFGLGESGQQIPPVAVSIALAFVGYGLVDHDDVLKIELLGVPVGVVARLKVGVEADGIDAVEVQVLEQRSVGPVSDDCLHGREVGEERVFVELSQHVVSAVTVHVAVDGLSRNGREGSHVDDAPRQAPVGGVVVDVVGIGHIGRLRIVEGAARAPLGLHADVAQRVPVAEGTVVDAVLADLHRGGQLGQVSLVIAVGMSEDGIEEVACDVVVGVPLFIEAVLVFGRPDTALERVLAVVGGEEEDGLAVEGRYLEEEASTVVRHLHAAGAHAVFLHLGLNEHLMLDRFLVDAKIAAVGGVAAVGGCAVAVGGCAAAVDGRAAVGLVVLRGLDAALRDILACRPAAHRHAAFADGVERLVDHLVGHALRGGEACHRVGFEHLHAELLTHASLHGERGLRGIAQALEGHLPESHLPLRLAQRCVLAPSLHHEQHVEVAAVCGVVALKVIGRRSDEALEIAAQEQVGEHVAVAVGAVVGACVAQRDADGKARRAVVGGDGEADGLIGLVVGLVGGDAQGRGHVVVVDEKGAGGQHVAVGVEHHELVDACGQLAHVGRNRAVALQTGKQHQAAPAEHGIGSRRASPATQGEGGALPVAVEVGVLQADHGSGLFGLGQPEGMGAAVPGEGDLAAVALVGGCIGEGAPAHVAALHRGGTVELAAERDGLAILVGDLERHTTLKSGDQHAAFREEGAQQLVFLDKWHFALGPCVHVLAVVVASLARTAVDGYDAAVEPFPVTVVVARHLVVVEQCAVVACVGA